MTNILEIKKEALVTTLREERGENFDIREIKVNDFNSNVFETYYSELINQDEYLVVTEEERDYEHKEKFDSLLDELGLESFSKDFQETILRNFVCDNFFEEVVRENFENHINDMDDEDYLEEYEDAFREDTIEELIEDVRDCVQYCLDNYGKDWVNNSIRENYLSIDWEKVRELCIEVDGYANLLANYDGEEMEIFVSELQEILYIYRQS